jgi:hypothetical protein
MPGMFTREDHMDLQARGISEADIDRQLKRFREGFPFLAIARPTTIGDGILRPGDDTLQDFIDLFESNSAREVVLKFVPASGAATRMFKELYAVLENDGSNTGNNALEKFMTNLSAFAFYDKLKSCLENKGLDPQALIKSGNYLPVIRFLLGKEGLNYGFLPKGLLAFHKYSNSSRTAFEEHLVEGALYSKGSNNIVRLHLTVSPEHTESFKKSFAEAEPGYENKFGYKFKVDFSTQKPSTDTLAVDPDNKPFRDANGRLVFRPGGHGALLENLSELDADIIFVKNIDNVVQDHLKEETVRYKKALGGMLLSFRERIYYYMNILASDTGNHEGLIDEIMAFLTEELCMVCPWGNDQWSMEKKIRYLITKLDRPLRICGMVRNEGEPGGGPFWVKNHDGSVSLQIVESSQVNLSNPLMKKLFNASTHFNPVDLVCSVKDYKGNKYDLHRFLDPDTGFISHKSDKGRELKALELPGLWNGAMADWNTVFVEVPLSTFNPVKTVNDLLRPEHLPEDHYILSGKQP